MDGPEIEYAAIRPAPDKSPLELAAKLPRQMDSNVKVLAIRTFIVLSDPYCGPPKLVAPEQVAEPRDHLAAKEMPHVG
jgi:hypothetical protein